MIATIYWSIYVVNSENIHPGVENFPLLLNLLQHLAPLILIWTDQHRFPPHDNAVFFSPSWIVSFYLLMLAWRGVAVYGILATYFWPKTLGFVLYAEGLHWLFA